MKKKLLFCALCSALQCAHAANDDTRLRLEQQLHQQQLQQEQSLQQLRQPSPEDLPVMVINGETVAIAQNAADVGSALYIAVMQKQWQAAQIYLQAYLKLEGHDPSLALFAQAALARMQGNLKQAEQQFQQAAAMQPQNMMIKLELARVLTERQKNKAAEQLFQSVKDHLAQSSDETAQNIIKTVDLYLKGLKQRDSWQGSAAFGARYAGNINSASERHKTITYYQKDPDSGASIPVAEVRQGTPAAVAAAGLDYEAALAKRWTLSGNHGIAARGLLYGQAYPEQSDYDELTLNLNAGYSYQDERNQVLAAPVFEYKYYGHEAYYNSLGGRAEWMRFIGQDKALKLEAEIKDIHHLKYAQQSGVESSVFATFWKVLPQQWTLFGGLDYVDHNSEEQYFTAYEQQGMRLGLSKQFNAGFYAALFSSYRWRQFDQYIAGLGFDARRHDFEQNYTLVFSAPKWELYGLTPNLTYQYNKNRSNVDWLYSYDKHSVSLKLERRF